MPGPIDKQAAVDYQIDDGPGTSPTVRIRLSPRLGFHYDLLLTKGAAGFTGTMERTDAYYPGPPYRVQGTTIGELTKACWEVLNEGYQLKYDEALKSGDRTRAAQIPLERNREQQNLMADIERQFRPMPPGPRTNWSRPWDHALKEGSMANIQRNVSKAKFLEQFRAAFPAWTVEVSGGELIAMAAHKDTWEATQADVSRLLTLVQGMNVLVTTQSRQGRTIITVDVRALPN